MGSQQVYKLVSRVERAIDEVDCLLAPGDKNLTLDFQQTRFVSVEALEWLEELLLRSKSLQVKVSFVNVPPTVYKVFKVAHVGSLIQACGALEPSGPAC